MDSKPERPQGFVFAKQATAVDVAGGGSSWQQQAAAASGKQGSQRLPDPPVTIDSIYSIPAV